MEYALRYVKLGDQSVAISFRPQLVTGAKVKVGLSGHPDPVRGPAVYVNVLCKPYEIVRHCVPVFRQEHVLVTADLDRVIGQVHRQKKRLERLVLVSLAYGYAH